MIDVEGHCRLVDLKQPRVACDFVIQVVSSHDPWSLPGTLAPASISNNNDTSICISATCLCSTPEHSPYTPPVQSFQLRAYEQGTHARLNQIHDDLRTLWREYDDVLRDLKTKHESGVQVDKRKSKVRPLSCIFPRSALTLELTAGG